MITGCGVVGNATQTLLYYTRTVWSRRAQCAASGVLAMALTSSGIATLHARQELPQALSAAVAGFTTRQVSDRAVDLRLILKPGAEPRADKLIEVADASVQALTPAFGPFPYPRLTVVDLPWQTPFLGSWYPGAVVTSSRWITIERDGSVDRRTIAAVSRQFWVGAAAVEQPWFDEGLARYAAERTIEGVLQGRQYWSRRYFGDFFPYAVRSMPLSPPRSKGAGYILRYDDDPALDPQVRQAALALHTLERYVGWPALQQGLEAYRAQFPTGGGSTTALLQILNQQGARDLGWFFAEAFKPGVRFDYGIERFRTEPDGSRHRVTLDVRRFGNGVFAGTSRPRTEAAGQGIAVRIQFADGTSTREWWDGRDETRTIQLISATAPVLADVDPERMLLLDEQRANNSRRLDTAPVYPPLRRAVVSWIVWLQDLMMACSALA